MSFVRKDPPPLYIPYSAEPPEFGNDDKVTNDGKQVVSNNATFFYEVMKYISHAEGEIYEEGVNIDPAKTTERDLEKIKIQDVVNIDNKYKTEFGNNGFNSKDGGFGFVQTDGKGLNIAGGGTGKFAKGFNFTPAFYEFFLGKYATINKSKIPKKDFEAVSRLCIDPNSNILELKPEITEETVKGMAFEDKGTADILIKAIDRKKYISKNVNFFISENEFNSGTLEANDGDIENTPIPVYAPSTGKNKFNGTGQQYFVNYFPTDYANQFYGTNGDLRIGNNLPNVSAYNSKIFQDAQKFFKRDGGITIKNINGEEIDKPSFYEIAMDPGAPWNNNNNNQWYAGKNPGEVSFNMAVLFLESKRRYFAGMTQIVGPHTDTINQNATVDKSKIPGKDLEEVKKVVADIGASILTIKPEATNDEIMNLKVDYGTKRLLLESKSKLMAHQKKLLVESKIGKAMGSKNLMAFLPVLDAQGRLSQQLDLMSTGEGFSDFTEYTDAAQMKKFRDWMLTNLSSYRNDFLRTIPEGLDEKLSVPNFRKENSSRTENPKNSAPKEIVIDIPGDHHKIGNIRVSGGDYEINGNIVTLKAKNVNYSITYDYASKSKWQEFNTKLREINNYLNSNNINLSSYKFNEYADKIRTLLGLSIETAANDSMTSEIANNGLANEAKKIKDGFSYDQMVYELYYEAPASEEGGKYKTANGKYIGKYGAEANYDKQPRSLKKNTGWNDKTAQEIIGDIPIRSYLTEHFGMNLLNMQRKVTHEREEKEYKEYEEEQLEEMKWNAKIEGKKRAERKALQKKK